MMRFGGLQMQKERAPTRTGGKAKVSTINLNSAKFKLVQEHAYNELKETSARYKNLKKKVKRAEKPKGHPPPPLNCAFQLSV
jgi:hypothetical protein